MYVALPKIGYNPPIFIYNSLPLKFMTFDTFLQKFSKRREMKKEWKIISEYPNYKISNKGEVYSIRRKKMLKLGKDSKGFVFVNLQGNIKWVKKHIHRLVALEFVDGWFDGAIVRHKDGKKQNNYANNLEWVTRSQNIKHNLSVGLNPTRRVIWKKAKRPYKKSE